MLLRALVLAAPLAMITACSAAVEPPPPGAGQVTTSASAWTLYQGSASPTPAGSPLPDTVAAGTFLPYRPGSPAITYDVTAVPPGATAQVAITAGIAGTTVRVRTGGLVPRRAYGAHLHARPCTATPDGAGPHHQHMPDPAAAASPPSVNPSYANPRNEVWLDFTADATGAGDATSRVPWTFPPGGSARSLVLHADRTRTAPGAAGSAGPRVACLTLPAR